MLSFILQLAFINFDKFMLMILLKLYEMRHIGTFIEKEAFF